MSNAQINRIVIEVLSARDGNSFLNINRTLGEVLGKYVPSNQLVYINSVKIEVLAQRGNNNPLKVNRILGEVLGKIA